MLTLLHVVGARPNFMKLAPVFLAARKRGDIGQVIVHTGQHYDQAMSGRFFDELGLPPPDEDLGVGSGTHAEQTGRIMLGFEPMLDRYQPDWVVVYGDVNSTLACALVAAKKGVRVAHVEAGLRSRDRSMPEEINRLLTDQIADLLLTPSRDGDRNLVAEGVSPEKIRFVGNVMADTLLAQLESALTLEMPSRLGVGGGRYAFVTLHRPSNVDQPEILRGLLEGLEDLAGRMPVLFAIHPRTQDRISRFGLERVAQTVRLLPPLGYHETLSLVAHAALVVTDSGGLQEETTVLGIPCLTVRPNTERPVTVSEGTNQLVASTRAALGAAVESALGGSGAVPGIRRPELWDGHAGERIVEAIRQARGEPVATAP